MALVILANSGNLKRAQLCAELRKITFLDHLLFVLDRLTDTKALRRGMNALVHHRDFTLRALFVILPEHHYLDHQDILGYGLFRHKDFDEKYLCAFLELTEFGAGTDVIDRLAQDQRHQSLLIDVLQKYKYPDCYNKNIAVAIVRHPLTVEQLSDLITTTDHIGAKLVFAKAAVQLNDLGPDVVRGFFRQIEGYAQREVEFIDAVHLSAGETFFVLLTETEFEPTREACVRKLKCCTHSIAPMRSDGSTSFWRSATECFQHCNSSTSSSTSETTSRQRGT